MKPNTVIDSVRKGDLGGSRIEMGLDQTAAAHIMSILTDLYSDPELAVIREYSTNARDSHIEAGHPDRPIDVTLPNRMSPFFTIRDYGVGMDHDTIAEVYSKYGASTKRGGNEQTGMLGLGGKSALTYTNQFTVIGIKNGVKTTVVVSRNDDGGGVMQVVDTCSTDEENGVTITIPAVLGHFDAKVHRFFRFWPAGSVLINGEPHHPADLEKVTDSTFVDRNDNTDYVVMGGVGYPVAFNRRREIVPHRRFGVIMFVDMGEVNFTPSREELHYTTLTLATLTKQYDDFEGAIKAQIQADLDTATNHREAYEKASKWRETFGSNFYSPKYKGEPIPSDYLSLPEGTIRIYINKWSNPKYSTHIGNFRSPILPGKEVVFVHGVDKTVDKITTYDRNRINKWAENEAGIEGATFNLMSSTDVDDWGNDWAFELKARSVSWEIIKAYKPPRTGTTSEKSEPIYSVYSEGESLNLTKSEVEDLVSSGNMNIYYYSPSQVRLGYRESKDRSRYAHLTARRVSKYMKAIVCVLGENRWEKFLRDFPTATRMQPAYKAWFQAQEATISPAEKISLALSENHYLAQSLKALAKVADRIDDPDLVALSKVVSVTQSDYVREDRQYAWWAAYRLGFVDYERPNNSDVLDTGVMKRYPVIDISAFDDRNNVDDAILYVNAKYATIKDTL